MVPEAANVRGPCPSCGAALATDQRYCVECGHRIGPPLALPYALPAPLAAFDQAQPAWYAALPMPLQMATMFAALALGLGVVVGTAISPNLAGIVAAPPPTVVAQAPPETAAAPATGGGGGGSGTATAFAGPVSSFGSSTPTSTGGGGGSGGGGGGKKKKPSPATPITFSGTVVRANPVAQSYTISSNGGLIAIHADSLPDPGAQIETDAVRLRNGTYLQQGSRNQTGTTDQASFLGTVTYCADLEHPSAPCDGSSQTDHYVYTVSSLGASVLVSAPYPAAKAPPAIGAQVQVGVHIRNAFAPIAPDAWATDPSCTPPWDEQNGLPSPGPKVPELTQDSVNVSGQAANATLEAVVQTTCPGNPPKLVLSADDVREAGRDLFPVAAPDAIDLKKLNPGQAVQAAFVVENDGTLTLKGITSDNGAGGANDATQGQGTLAGS
jgi:hypothetical protein